MYETAITAANGDGKILNNQSNGTCSTPLLVTMYRMPDMATQFLTSHPNAQCVSNRENLVKYICCVKNDFNHKGAKWMLFQFNSIIFCFK